MRRLTPVDGGHAKSPALAIAGVLFLYLFIGSAAEARDAFIPPGNADLWTISRRVSDIKATAEYCRNMECPNINCSEAAVVIKALNEAKAYIGAMTPWLQKAGKAYLNSMASLSGQTQITSSQIGRAVWAQGVHKALHDFGAALLDIASVMSAIQDIATSPLKPESALDALSKLDGLYEAYKDGESLANNLAGTGTPVGDAGAKADGVALTGDFNNDKSTFSDLMAIRSELKEAYKNGGEKALMDALKNEKLTPGNVTSTFKGGAKGGVKDALTGKGGGSKGFFKGQKPTPWAALGQIAGRYLKSESANRMKARAGRIKGDYAVLAAEEGALKGAFNDRRAILMRWELIDAAVQDYSQPDGRDLLGDIDAAIAALTACMTKAKCAPATATRPSLPSGAQPGPRTTYGSALMALNQAVARLNSLDTLNPTRIDPRNRCPEDQTPGGMAYKVGGDYTPIPLTAVRVGQDSNTWCRHQTGVPATVPFYWGPPGPTVVDDDDVVVVSPGAWPTSVTQPPAEIYSAPQGGPRANVTTPTPASPDAPFLYSPVISPTCPQGNCGGGLFYNPQPPAVQIYGDGSPDCFGSDCAGNVVDPSQTATADDDVTSTPEQPASSTPEQPASSTPEMPSYFSTTTGMKIELSVVRESLAGQQSVSGQSLKITGMDFGLPPECTEGCDESAKTDVASNLGPSQCITGADGSCTIDVPACEFGSAAQCGAEIPVGVGDVTSRYNQTGAQPQTGPVDYTIPVTLVGTPVASSIGEVPGAPTGCALGGNLCDAVTDQFAIGPNTYYVFVYPASEEDAYLTNIGQDPNVRSVETNFCGEKKLPSPKTW